MFDHEVLDRVDLREIAHVYGAGERAALPARKQVGAKSLGWNGRATHRPCFWIGARFLRSCCFSTRSLDHRKRAALTVAVRRQPINRQP